MASGISTFRTIWKVVEPIACAASTTPLSTSSRLPSVSYTHLELPFSYYDRMPVGYLMSRLTNDTQRLADTIGW